LYLWIVVRRSPVNTAMASMLVIRRPGSRQMPLRQMRESGSRAWLQIGHLSSAKGSSFRDAHQVHTRTGPLIS
jgi:hypothetical protein